MQVFLDVYIQSSYAGRIVIGLFGKDAPRSVDNFLKLVDGRAPGAAGMSYDYSIIFKVEKV